MKVAIYGVGNFGYAILKHLDKYMDKNNHSLFAYEYEKEVLEHLREHHEHLFLHKGVKVSKNITFVNDVEELVSDADVLVVAVTSNATKSVISQIKPYLKKGMILLNTAKALDNQTGDLLSKTYENELKDFDYSYSMLAGGTIASDMFKHDPLGIDIASKDEKTLKVLKELFESESLNVYTTTDLMGVEYAASFKNVISIFAGIMKGIGFSYGSETHIISRGAHEIEKLIMSKFNADKETFSMGSQCWGNDLWMSCTGNTRNREFGILIGKGMSVDDALEDMNNRRRSVEGINTIRIMDEVIDVYHDYPLFKGLKDIVIEGKDARETIKELMKSNKI
jgi:glycerol-3-phosphate dehydrogenase (NAD(P)+)